LPFDRSVGVSDGDVVDIRNGREHHIVRVGLRLKYGSKPWVSSDRAIRIGAFCDDVTRSMQNGIREEFGARPAFLESYLR
jgi:hypothetical protein